MNDPEFLNWIADRLIHVYGESPNVDYVQKLRKMADVQLARDDAELYGTGYLVDGKRVAPGAVTVILPRKCKRCGGTGVLHGFMGIKVQCFDCVKHQK